MTVRPFVINVTAPQTTFPYTLPSSGQAVAIGTNYATDVRPSSHTQTQWAYSMFSSFGSGAYVADYSFGGAYVLAGTGGHNHPPNVGACLFDFADATWKLLANANGVAWRSNDYQDSELSGPPYREILGTSVPAPPHPYRHMVGIKTANGGGSKGSIVYMCRAAVGVQASGSSGIHRFDLDTRLWSRVTNSTPSFGADAESDAVVDDAVGRVYGLANAIHYQNKLPTLTTSTGVLTETVIPTPNYYGSGYPSAFLHPTHRLLVHHRAGTMQAINVDSPGSGFTLLTVNGLAASAATASSNAFCYYPPTGNFYWMPPDGGNTLTRLVPPASNPLTSAWAVDTVTISLVGGGAIPPAGDRTQNASAYRSLCFAEKTGCLAWIAGETVSGTRRSVYLLKPST